jgi:hypothetical protein
MSTAKPVYSTVEPTLEEKQLLPERFRKADEWPVTDIIAEKAGKYLVEWEPHPNTGAVWKPEWVCGLYLQNAWATGLTLYREKQPTLATT